MQSAYVQAMPGVGTGVGTQANISVGGGPPGNVSFGGQGIRPVRSTGAAAGTSVGPGQAFTSVVCSQ